MTSAVADEAQGGFSESNTDSHSNQVGASEGIGLSIPGVSFGGSVNVGSANSRSHADSHSSSWGQKDLGSSMLQNVNDRTHQHAHSSRSQRASVVREVSQSEHEGISTRVVANYNHMHAMTVQYYEVVQIHRVETALSKVDKVIFIPVALVDFNSVDVVRRFQSVLIGAALGPAIQDSIRNMDVVELAPAKSNQYTFQAADVATPAGAPVNDAMSSFEPATASSGTPATAAPSVAVTRAVMSVANLPELIRMAETSALAVPTVAVNDHLWGSQTATLSSLMATPVLRGGSTSLFLPNDLYIEGWSTGGGYHGDVTFMSIDGTLIPQVGPLNPVALNTVKSISVSGDALGDNTTVQVTLMAQRNGVRFPVDLPSISVQSGPFSVELVSVKTGGINNNLLQHLTANRLYYSQAIFRSLTSTDIAALLADYSINVLDQSAPEGTAPSPVPLSQVIDPMPIRYIGNYLAFKMSAAVDPKWAKWMSDRGLKLGSTQEDLVPLGTGGTFAEAVLGRSNSAEKLDITRYWNWQDSPIPLQPSDIAPIEAVKPTNNESIQPGQFSAPMINITNPTALPDPTGTAAVLAALQNGSTFRDMSGLQSTIGLAGTSLQTTAAAATAADQEAGADVNRILSSMSKNVSEEGAKLNHAEQKAAAAPARPSGNGSAAPPASPAGSGTTPAPQNSPFGAAGGAPTGNSPQPTAPTPVQGPALISTPPSLAPTVPPQGSFAFEYPVLLVPQSTKESCWAASIAMLVGYERKVNVTDEQLANDIGRSLETSYDWATVQGFFDHYNVRGISGLSSAVPTTDQWYAWLRQFGPLSVTIIGNPLHAVVVYGIESDGSPEGTKLKIHNPWNTATTFDGDPIHFNPANTGRDDEVPVSVFSKWEFGPATAMEVYKNWRVMYDGNIAAAIAAGRTP